MADFPLSLGDGASLRSHPTGTTSDSRDCDSDDHNYNDADCDEQDDNFDHIDEHGDKHDNNLSDIDFLPHDYSNLDCSHQNKHYDSEAYIHCHNQCDYDCGEHNCDYSLDSFHNYLDSDKSENGDLNDDSDFAHDALLAHTHIQHHDDIDNNFHETYYSLFAHNHI